MMNIEKLVRKNIRDLQPYSCARDEYSGHDAVFLDANENPFDNGFNRYPDPYQRELKEVIANLKGVAARNMLLGNGSDEIIDLLIRSFCEPGRDNIIVFSPGYAMYEVCAAINQVEVRKINLTADFLPDWQKLRTIKDEATKLVFLCTPNNPTGKVIPYREIEQLCREFEGLIVVDEAYIDFTDQPSTVNLLEQYPQVVVLQTLSKAWGMAGLRLGMCFADQEVIGILNKVKPPYNISSLTQQTALKMLQQYDSFLEKCRMLKNERLRMLTELRKLQVFSRVYDSEANFILAISPRCRELYNALTQQKIVVRLRDIPPLIQGGVRITVGTPEENNRLLEVLKAGF